MKGRHTLHKDEHNVRLKNSPLNEFTSVIILCQSCELTICKISFKLLSIILAAMLMNVISKW